MVGGRRSFKLNSISWASPPSPRFRGSASVVPIMQKIKKARARALMPWVYPRALLSPHHAHCNVSLLLFRTPTPLLFARCCPSVHVRVSFGSNRLAPSQMHLEIHAFFPASSLTPCPPSPHSHPSHRSTATQQKESRMQPNHQVRVLEEGERGRGSEIRGIPPAALSRWQVCGAVAPWRAHTFTCQGPCSKDTSVCMVVGSSGKT